MNDLIDRQSVLNAFDYWVKSPMIGYTNGLVKLREMFEGLPPVTSAEKVGQWEWNQYDSNPKIGNFHCSQCHGIGKAYYDYCPYCGSRMIQEVKE